MLSVLAGASTALGGIKPDELKARARLEIFYFVEPLDVIFKGRLYLHSFDPFIFLTVILKFISQLITLNYLTHQISALSVKQIFEVLKPMLERFAKIKDS